MEHDHDHDHHHHEHDHAHEQGRGEGEDAPDMSGWLATTGKTTCPACGAVGAVTLGGGLFCPACGAVTTNPGYQPPPASGA